MLKIRSLIWDEWNVEHIKKHKVSVDEVEEVIGFRIKTFKSYKGRILVLGNTEKGRLLTVVLALEGRGKYYVVTARNMSKKERRYLKK